MTLKKRILAMVEGALMLAMATVLGYFRLYRFPFGGSIDLALVPILVYCLRWGGKWGTLCALIYGILEYFLGGGIAISWQSMVLDYVGCNMMTGLCGLGCGRKGGWLWGPVLPTPATELMKRYFIPLPPFLNFPAVSERFWCR